MTSQNDETRVFVAGDKDPSEQLVGMTLAGRYHIEKLLGVGAMGAVYLGRHLKIGRRDAIKVLHSQQARDPDAIARFDRGARNVGAIRHANVCTIYDFSDTDDGLQYLAMEYVAGDTLKDVLDREGRMPLDRSLSIIAQVASALQAAHDAGIVHRDLKPANIMIAAAADGTDLVKVVDFDISKGSTDAVEAEVTRLGYVVGTPEYMSPEQLWGGQLDGRSDVYSMALVLYRMLTGGLPFRGNSVQETMSARLTDTPPLRLEELALGVSFPAELQGALDRALKPKAADRTASAAQFAREIDALRVPPASSTAHELPPTRVTPSSVAAPLASTPGRNRARPMMAAAVVLVIALSGFAVSQSGLLARAEQSALPDDGTQPLLSGDDVQPAGLDDAATDDPPPPAPGSGSTRQPQQAAATTSNPPASQLRQEPVPPPSQPRIQLEPEQARTILSAQRERLTLGPMPNAATMRAMRDTAVTFYGLAGVADAQRALAAHVAAAASFQLGELATCVTWANNALAIQRSAAYDAILRACEDAR